MIANGRMVPYVIAAPQNSIIAYLYIGLDGIFLKNKNIITEFSSGAYCCSGMNKTSQTEPKAFYFLVNRLSHLVHAFVTNGNKSFRVIRRMLFQQIFDGNKRHAVDFIALLKLIVTSES